MTAPTTTWQARAACRGTDPEMWHNRLHPEPPRICATCPVLAECRHASTARTKQRIRERNAA